MSKIPMTKREREVTDIEQILQIIRAGKIIHLGLWDGEEVYLLPMNFGCEYVDGQLVFYMHGALKGRKYDILAKNPKVAFELESGLEPFAGRVACQYGMSYGCVMGKGVVELLETPEEKIAAMQVFMRCQTGKTFDFDEKMVSIIQVMKLTVTAYSAKMRPVPKGQGRLLPNP